jgi:D-serine deaminase-like pyridoxal phosphate-dependent protein
MRGPVETQLAFADLPVSGPRQSLEVLDTPTVLVDLDRLERNISNWQSWMDLHNVRFRPHIKTHKVPEIALLQIAAGACGIVCAKVSEAEPFAAVGIRDICIAYPVFGELKWRRIAELARQGVRVTVNCDNPAAAAGLSNAAQSAGVTLYLQIDVDSGLHRGGIPTNDTNSIQRLAREIEKLPGIEFDGITTFRGHAYENAPDPHESGHEEARKLIQVAANLRGAGIEVPNVTAGSTPTGKSVAEVSGITEVRAGTYVFNDLMQLSIGSAREDELALSVLCTVTSLGQNGRVTVDAGSKTFSGDVPQSADRLPIARAVDLPILLERLSEEHGVARTERPLELGSKIRFFPYHACTCVNMSDTMIGIRNDRIEVVWPVKARGKRA